MHLFPFNQRLYASVYLITVRVFLRHALCPQKCYINRALMMCIDERKGYKILIELIIYHLLNRLPASSINHKLGHSLIIF